jgi:raffinose/stachyose/melibiose transport system permease protein
LWSQRRFQTLLLYLLLTVFLLLAIIPFVTITLTALKSRDELVRGAFSLPEAWRWSNYAEAWNQGHFSQYSLSSVIVVVPVVLVSSLLSVMTGYAFGRMRFPFSRILFFTLLLGLMVPLEALIIPLYYNLRWLGLLDSYYALILPQIGLSVSFGTFWMRGFFAQVPQDLVDAATVDGCNSWQALWRVLLPMVQPAILSMMVLFFIWTWNDFLLALVLVSTENLRTLPLGLAFFQGQRMTNIPLVAAAATMVAIPAIMMYIAFQRHFIRGITGGSVQG